MQSNFGVSGKIDWSAALGRLRIVVLGPALGVPWITANLLTEIFCWVSHLRVAAWVKVCAPSALTPGVCWTGRGVIWACKRSFPLLRGSDFRSLKVSLGVGGGTGPPPRSFCCRRTNTAMLRIAGPLLGLALANAQKARQRQRPRIAKALICQRPKNIAERTPRAPQPV
jgi:hypothetical protein